jgi:hypothetical protein
MYERAQKPMKQSAKPTHMTACSTVLEMDGLLGLSQLTFMASTGIRCPVVRSSWSSDGDKDMMMLEAQTPRETPKDDQQWMKNGHKRAPEERPW